MADLDGLQEVADREAIAQFFAELDRRIDGTSEVETPADARALLAVARPVLVERAERFPRLFAETLMTTLQELGAEGGEQNGADDDQPEGAAG